MGLKLHHVKAHPKVDESVIGEKLAICNTFQSIKSISCPGA